MWVFFFPFPSQNQYPKYGLFNLIGAVASKEQRSDNLNRLLQTSVGLILQDIYHY